MSGYKKYECFRLGICRCGCGEDIPIIHLPAPRSTTGYLRKFKLHHSNRKGISQNKGENNGHWNENVGYDGIHTWVKRNLPKPESCEFCGRNVRLEAANISGKYLRDLTDWKYLCRRCHMLSDGRMRNLKQYAKV